MTITYDRESKRFKGITAEQAQFWQDCYKDLDVDDILFKRIPPWADANKPKKNWKRFIVNWLSKAQREAEFRKHISRGGYVPSD